MRGDAGGFIHDGAGTGSRGPWWVPACSGGPGAPPARLPGAEAAAPGTPLQSRRGSAAWGEPRETQPTKFPVFALSSPRILPASTPRRCYKEHSTAGKGFPVS